jgi:uncharacterized protein (DUF2147 family)
MVMMVLHSRKLQMLLLAPVVMGWLCGAPLAAVTAGSGVFAVDAAEQSAPISSNSPAGFWMTEDHAWTVQISRCGSLYCGTIVGLGWSPRPDAVRTDLQNPDPAKRTATLCGLPVLGGFMPVLDTPGKWENGWIYDPETGKTYQSEIKLEGSDRLNLRGFVIMSLFGRSEHLTRVSAPLSRCSNVPGVATGIPATASTS